MSEFLAEARILVRPDTTRFRAELEVALAKATAKPITVPVVPVVAGGLSSATAQTAAFATAQGSAAAETQRVAAELEKQAINTKKATKETSAYTGNLAKLKQGAGSAGLSLFGVRGATLAASSAFLVGAAAVTLFAKSLQSAASLETELNVFRVTAGATADEMDRVSESAKRLGRDITLPGVTAGDAATAMLELAKAGLSVQDSMNGARGALQLATAAQIDNVTATKLIAGALNAFQLSGNEAVKVADLLTGAANESQGEISDMGTALGQAAAVANLFGVSIGDTVTLLTELAQAGIEGGRAGTSLRVAFLRLVNPPAQAAKILKELNVQIRDINGNLRPQVFTDIQKALEGYTKAQQQAKLATIFGSDAIRAAAIIGAKGTEGFKTTSDAINEFGLAQQQAAARTSGLQGDLENLQNQVGAFGLTFGNVAKGPVSLLTKALADQVETMNTVADASITVGGGVADLGKAMADAIPFVDRLSGQLEHLKTVLSFGPFIAPFKAVAVVANQFSEDIKADAADIRSEIQSIVKAGQQTGGDLGLNQTLVSLDLLVEKLNKGGPEAQKFATAVAGVRTELQKAGTTGFKLFPDNVEDLFPPALLTGEVARKAGEANRQALQNALPGSDLFSFTKASFDNVTRAIEVSGAEARDAAKRVFANVVNAAQEQIAKVSEAFDVAVAGGSRSGQLAALRKQASEQQEIIDAANKAAKAVGAGNEGFATAVAKRRQAQHELASTNQQIRGIEAEIASDAARTAADIKASRDAANKSILDALKAKKDAADLILKRIAEQKEAQRRQQEALEASFRLDINFSQLNNNQSGEIRAREALIKQLKKEQALTTRGTNEWKNLRNEIAEQVAAIKALNEEKKKQVEVVKAGQSFAQASFEFLQTQQGFASNLLGNLIPTGATAGLVGGGSVQGALTPVAGAADARSQSGVTSGQGNATNSLLARILQQLVELNGDQAAPEATRQNWGQKAIMDY